MRSIHLCEYYYLFSTHTHGTGGDYNTSRLQNIKYIMTRRQTLLDHMGTNNIFLPFVFFLK